MTNEIAERYGQGLLELAKETNTVKEKKENAELVIAQMEENSDIVIFFNAVKISKDEKKKFIDQVFGQLIDKDMINLMKLVIDKGRSYYLKSILQAYVDLADDELGILHATVASARPLSKDDLNKIKSALVTKYNKEIILKNTVDSSLIAGIKVTVGNNVADVTTKSRIDDMKRLLVKGGQA